MLSIGSYLDEGAYYPELIIICTHNKYCLILSTPNLYVRPCVFMSVFWINVVFQLSFCSNIRQTLFTLRVRIDRPEQTVQTQIRRQRTRRLIRVYTVCYSSSNFSTHHHLVKRTFGNCSLSWTYSLLFCRTLG